MDLRRFTVHGYGSLLRAKLHHDRPAVITQSPPIEGNLGVSPKVGQRQSHPVRLCRQTDGVIPQCTVERRHIQQSILVRGRRVVHRVWRRCGSCMGLCHAKVGRHAPCRQIEPISCRGSTVSRNGNSSDHRHDGHDQDELQQAESEACTREALRHAAYGNARKSQTMASRPCV